MDHNDSLILLLMNITVNSCLRIFFPFLSFLANMDNVLCSLMHGCFCSYETDYKKTVLLDQRTCMFLLNRFQLADNSVAFTMCQTLS